MQSVLQEEFFYLALPTLKLSTQLILTMQLLSTYLTSSASQSWTLIFLQLDRSPSTIILPSRAIGLWECMLTQWASRKYNLATPQVKSRNTSGSSIHQCTLPKGSMDLLHNFLPPKHVLSLEHYPKLSVTMWNDGSPGQFRLEWSTIEVAA